jgi:hypothetical protein
MQVAQHDIEFNVSPEFILLQYQGQYYFAVNAYDQALFLEVDYIEYASQNPVMYGERVDPTRYSLGSLPSRFFGTGASHEISARRTDRSIKRA